MTEISGCPQLLKPLVLQKGALGDEAVQKSTWFSHFLSDAPGWLCVHFSMTRTEQQSISSKILAESFDAMAKDGHGPPHDIFKCPSCCQIWLKLQISKCPLRSSWNAHSEGILSGSMDTISAFTCLSDFPNSRPSETLEYGQRVLSWHGKRSAGMFKEVASALRQSQAPSQTTCWNEVEGLSHTVFGRSEDCRQFERRVAQKSFRSRAFLSSFF